MALRKSSQILKKNKKEELKITTSPVVNEEKTSNLKNIFGVFSQFVAIGGDFV